MFAVLFDLVLYALGWTYPGWSILCRVGCKTRTQIVPF